MKCEEFFDPLSDYKFFTDDSSFLDSRNKPIQNRLKIIYFQKNIVMPL